MSLNKTMRPNRDLYIFNRISRYLTLTCILLCVIAVPQINCSRAMKRLFEDLFSDYNRLILPVANNRSKVTVTLGLKLGQILDLNLKQQILSTNIWVEQSWFDYKLTWDPSKYLGIDMIHVPAENIWIPDIVLFNNADGNYELTMMTKAKVFYNGSVIWKPPTMFKSTCEIDVAYFPFDVQMCLLRFGSWTYAGDELELRLADQKAFHQDQKFPHVNIGIDLSEFHKNVEWDVIEVPAIYNEEYYDCCVEPYPDITFKIVIRRKILFYMVNLILPSAMMAFMTICVFYLPSKSDEKVTLSISILMALIVFFTMMLEIIPASSLAVPLFGKYLLFTLVLVSTSTCVTVFVLNIHYRSPSVHTMSPWMKKVFLRILPWWLGMKRPDIRERSSLVRFRKKRARKILSSLNNRQVHDSSISNSIQRSKQQSLNSSEAKLSDLIEETEDEDTGEDDEGRYFRRHIDKYRPECCSLHCNDNSNNSGSFNCRTNVACNQKRSFRQQQQQQEGFAQTTSQSSNNVRNRQSNFISLDSTTDMVRTMLDSGHSLGQQAKLDTSNNSLRSVKQQQQQHSASYNCVPQSSIRHPHVYMHNEDTLDMTFDYDDELPTPPPPPPPPLPLPPPPPLGPPPQSHRVQSRLNNDNDQQQMISLDVSSSSNDINEDTVRDPAATAFQMTSSFMQQQNNNLDSSVTGDDDCSNNGKSESYQSSLIMQQLINGAGGGGSSHQLDARLLLDSSIENQDSNQTVLTRRADSCTCWENIKSSASIQQQQQQQQFSGDVKNTQMTSSSPYRSTAATYYHQSNNNISQPGRSMASQMNQQQQNNNNNISSNYSSSTGATIPPPPPMLQSTMQLSQHHSNNNNHNNNINNNNNNNMGRRSVAASYHDDCNDCCGYENEGIKKTLYATSNNLSQCDHCNETFNNNNTTNNNNNNNNINNNGDNVNNKDNDNNNATANSVLMSLTLPYDQMPQYLRAAIRHTLFIADTIKNEDVENRAVEDWNFMSMVIDRLFLWLFFVLCSAGSFMLLMFAPSLYDNRPSIEDIFIKDDIPMNNCSAVITPSL